MDSNKLIAYNSIVIFIRLCVVSVVSLACSRFVLDALGASDYGLYNVVGGIVTLLNVVNSSMMSTTYRFIAFELGKKENSLLNKVFNTCFSIHACFSILIIIFGIIISRQTRSNSLPSETDFTNSSTASIPSVARMTSPYLERSFDKPYPNL